MDMQTCCVSRVVATSILATNTHTLTNIQGRQWKDKKQKKNDGKLAKKDCVCVCGVKGKKKRVAVCVAGGMKFNVRVEMCADLLIAHQNGVCWSLARVRPNSNTLSKKEKKRNERLGRLWSHVNCVFGLPRRSRTCTRDQQQTGEFV